MLDPALQSTRKQGLLGVFFGPKITPKRSLFEGSPNDFVVNPMGMPMGKASIFAFLTMGMPNHGLPGHFHTLFSIIWACLRCFS